MVVSRQSVLIFRFLCIVRSHQVLVWQSLGMSHVKEQKPDTALRQTCWSPLSG